MVNAEIVIVDKLGVFSEILKLRLLVYTTDGSFVVFVMVRFRVLYCFATVFCCGIYCNAKGAKNYIIVRPDETVASVLPPSLYCLFLWSWACVREKRFLETSRCWMSRTGGRIGECFKRRRILSGKNSVGAELPFGGCEILVAYEDYEGSAAPE